MGLKPGNGAKCDRTNCIHKSLLLCRLLHADISVCSGERLSGLMWNAAFSLPVADEHWLPVSICFRSSPVRSLWLSPLSTIVDSGFDIPRHSSSPSFSSPMDSTAC